MKEPEDRTFAGHSASYPLLTLDETESAPSIRSRVYSRSAGKILTILELDASEGVGNT